MSHVAILREKGMSLDKIEEYKAAFNLFDPEGAGVITTESLRKILNDSFGQSFGDEDLQYMLRQFLPGDGRSEVDFPTFALSLHSKMGDPRYNEAFGDAFDLFDTQKGGELSKEDLVYGMAKLNEKLTDAEAEEMLKVAKKKDDFVRVMSSSMAADLGSGGGGGGGGNTAAVSGAGAPAPSSTGGGPPRAGGSFTPPYPKHSHSSSPLIKPTHLLLSLRLFVQDHHQHPVVVAHPGQAVRSSPT